ncbi:MAG: TrkH family potassium uptake protein, partial [Bacteroidales bacterium]|nr:TrkH family potassium uptake protein [Bacteroidales bacterium]
TIYIFTYVYLGLVVSSFLLYMLAGMGPFDAISHAFSVSATGGFSTKNISIAGFDSLPITLITMVYMFLASIHFGMLWMVLVTRSLKPLKNEVLRLYTGYLVLVSIIAGVILKIDGLSATWGDAILDGSFSMLSYASTTGLAITDNAGYPFFVSMLMMLVGTVCGMAGSTTGGLKSDRLLILIKSIRAHIIQSLNPSSVTELKLHGTNLQMKDVYPQVLYVALYVFVWMVSVVLVLMSGVDTNNAIMATLSSIGNVGPSVGELGTFGNFGLQPSFAKLIYTLDMFMGRVEIYPVLSVIGMMLAPRKRI